MSQRWLLLAPAQRKRASMLYFANVFIYFFFNGRLILRPWWTEDRESFTRGGPWLSLKKLLRYLDFFLVILKLQGGPKSDEIWHIFRPRPQTFCSHSRTRQNIVILKKNLLSTDGCSTMCATFGKLSPTNSWDPRATKFLKNDAWIACDMSYFRLLDASTTTPEPLNLNPLIPTP